MWKNSKNDEDHIFYTKNKYAIFEDYLLFRDIIHTKH